MGKHLCFWEGRKTGERSVGCEAETRRLLPLPVTYREAVLGHGDAAGLHGDAHALPDAVGKAVRLGGSLAAVPRGAPGTHGHTSAHTAPQELNPLGMPRGPGLLPAARYPHFCMAGVLRVN